MPAAASDIRGVIGQAGQHSDVLTKRRQRFEDPREGEIGASLGQLPILHDDAVRHIHHTYAESLLRAGPGRSGERRPHRIQQGKSALPLLEWECGRRSPLLPGPGRSRLSA